MFSFINDNRIHFITGGDAEIIEEYLDLHLHEEDKAADSEEQRNNVSWTSVSSENISAPSLYPDETIATIDGNNEVIVGRINETTCQHGCIYSSDLADDECK